MRLLLSGRASRRRGASAVEFALIAPLLLTVVFGIIEFGYLFMARQMVHHAAADATRTAILPGYTDADVRASAQGQLASSLNLSTGQVIVTRDQATDAATDPCESVTVKVLVDDVALPGYILQLFGLRDPADAEGAGGDWITFTVTMAHPDFAGEVLGVTCAGPTPPP